MFENLSEKFQGVLKKLRGHGRISEGNVEGALNEVRLALLEADVNYKVVKEFVAAVKEKALGAEVLASLSPDQHFIKIVHEEMTRMMGAQAQELNLARKPPVPVMLVGLQGSGKTTTCGKLALYLQKRKRNPFLVPADVYRPAAIEQLKVLGRQLEIPVFDSRPDADPVTICREALKYAELNGYDPVLIDTAGRLHIDDAADGRSSSRIKAALDPAEILLVADAMTGQDAVNVRGRFHEGVGADRRDADEDGRRRPRRRGAVDPRGDRRADQVRRDGASSSTHLEPFHPDRDGVTHPRAWATSSRFIEKAQDQVDEKQAKELEQKLRKNEFTLEDFRDQLLRLKKMGSMEEILGMIPGLGAKAKELQGGAPDERS